MSTSSSSLGLSSPSSWCALFIRPQPPYPNFHLCLHDWIGSHCSKPLITVAARGLKSETLEEQCYYHQIQPDTSSAELLLWGFGNALTGRKTRDIKSRIYGGCQEGRYKTTLPWALREYLYPPW